MEFQKVVVFGVRVAGLIASISLASSSARAQTAIPERVATDQGLGNNFSVGITQFELYQSGVFWWKAGASSNEIVQREGTLAVKPSLGIFRPSLTLFGPRTRYLGRGFNFDITGATLDDLNVYYAANGYLRKRPLAADPTGVLADDTRITVERLRPPFGIEHAPVAANGAVTLWKDNIYYSNADAGNFYIQRPSGLLFSSIFSAPGQAVKRMVATEVLAEDGSRLKDSLIVLTQDGLLYQFDLDPIDTTPRLLARNVWDFAIRSESLRIPQGVFGFLRRYTTTIFAAIGDISASRQSGRLLRISARDRSVAVEYDTLSPNLQIRGVAADGNRVYLTVTPLLCGGIFGCSYDDPNSQILSRTSPAHPNLIEIAGPFGTIVDKTTAGQSVTGFNLRSDGRWLYWTTDNDIWRIPASATPIERDFEAIDIETVQTTQDLDGTTRLVANKPTFVRAYARVAKDSLGVNRYALTGTLRGFLNGVELSVSPLKPVNNPSITTTTDLRVLRGNRDNGFLFELPDDWIKKGRLRLEFTVNPVMGVPETGQNPLGNNSKSTTEMEVIQMGSPCLVFVPIHTAAPNYDPNAPGSGFGDILARADSLLPIDHFRFVIKGDRISKPVPTVKFWGPIPYPAIDYQSFVTEDGFSGALFWLKVYSTFESDPNDCGDTHFVGTVHWAANTTKDGVTALGLATRPNTGVAQDLVVKMDPPGIIPGQQPWSDPRGGVTLAHELGHNYTLKHIDQTTSPLMCGGLRPENAANYPCDTCTFGILNGANLNIELSSRTTQWGFDPLTWNVIAPDVAGDLMSYRSSSWLSKHSLDLLFGRIPGFDAPARLSIAPRQVQQGILPFPDHVILVNGQINLARNHAILERCYRLPSATFDPVKIAKSFEALQDESQWTLRFVDATGTTLSEYPLLVETLEDGNLDESMFIQFVPDQPDADRMQIFNGDTYITECIPSSNAPIVEIQSVEFDAANDRLRIDWRGSDLDRDPLGYTIQYSPDNGLTWQSLQVNYPDESFAANTRYLCGGEQSRVRVIASDGFNGAIAESELFSLPRRAPEILISGAVNGERIPFGQSRSLRALAYDADDGSLEPTSITWELTGAETQALNGPTLSLGALSPGIYTATASASDSDGETGFASLTFEISPLEIPESTTPILDGLCGDLAYEVATPIPVALGDGQFAFARIIHSGDAVYLCISELQYGPSEQALASIGVRTDRGAGKDRAPLADDLIGFFVDQTGIAFQVVGNDLIAPQPGFTARVEYGDTVWSAELRISDALFGGSTREAPIMITHFAPGNAQPVNVWPLGSDVLDPSSWSMGSVGVATTPTNRAPIAHAGAPQILWVEPGDRVTLDGSGSFDPDGDEIVYAWAQLDGAPVELEGAGSATPSFIVGPLESETSLRFRLIVGEAQLDSEPSETAVTLIPAPEPSTTATNPGPAKAQITDDGLLVRLIWPGNPGDLTEVLSSSNLKDWERLAYIPSNYLNLIQFTDPDYNLYDQRFYRAIATAPSTIETPQRAIRFDGQDDLATVFHRDSLNAFPITISFWLRTTDSDTNVRGLVTKYIDSSYNGYALFLYEGRVRAWYFKSRSDFVWDGNLGLASAFVADGQWRHVAFSVDASGGRLFIDGQESASQEWTGSPGAPSSQYPLQFGRYVSYPYSLTGDLDEVTIWSEALSSEEIVALIPSRLDPREDSRILNLWNFNETDGPSAGDSGPLGYTADLSPDIQWIESEVPRPLF